MWLKLQVVKYYRTSTGELMLSVLLGYIFSRLQALLNIGAFSKFDPFAEHVLPNFIIEIALQNFLLQQTCELRRTNSDKSILI